MTRGSLVCSCVQWRVPLCAVLLALLVVHVGGTDYNVGGGSNVQHEMDSLVDGVRSAVSEAERAKNHREVLDLGQSLHLLEHKFAGLKAAIAQEMGTKLPQQTHSEEAKRLVEQSSKLLDDVAAYRGDVERLFISIRDIEDNIQAAKTGMATFDREVDELNKLLADLHVSANELHQTHHSTNNLMESASRDLEMKRHQLRQPSSRHTLFFLILLVEAVAVAAFLYTKRSALKSAKSFHSF